MWELIGKIFVAYIALNILCYIYSFLRAYFFPLFGWRVNVKSYGEWAVVTGATDGIGKAYAMELARKGLKVVLISRSQEKLDAVAAEIREAHSTETKTIAFDFGESSGYERIADQLSGLQIGILVNNVGMGYEHPEFFDLVDVNVFAKMVNVNMLSAIKMTHLIIKGMLERKKGIVVNVSSASASTPIPMLTVYSASKAFMDFFGRALQMEYRDKGIISQSAIPFFVATKLAGVRPSLAAPTPDNYARQAIRTIGNADQTCGYWMHEVQLVFNKLIPAYFRENYILKLMKKVRAKALRKMNKKD